MKNSEKIFWIITNLSDDLVRPSSIVAETLDGIADVKIPVETISIGNREQMHK